MFRTKINFRLRSFPLKLTRFNSNSTTSPVKNAYLQKPIIFVGGALCGVIAMHFLGGQRAASSIQEEFKAADDVTIATAKRFAEKQKEDSSTLPLNELNLPRYASSDQIDAAVAQIKSIVEVVSNDKAELDSHSDTYFNSHHPSPTERPKYVVYPKLTEEVSQVLKICHEFRVPVIPISGGSSLEGHFIPTRGGISLDMTGMNQIVKLNEDDLDMTVQTGVGWEALADYLEPYRLMFGPDPGPGANIGGMCATNCSGTNASKYGECYKNILSLTVVLADGTIVKTRQRPKKSSAGYNLTSLFIGSEGTLGVITEATIKLHVKPAFETVAVVPFPKIELAAEAVNSILKHGIELNAMELMDDKMLKCVNESGGTTRKWTELPTLFFKIGGSNEDIINNLVAQLKDITSKYGNKEFLFATDSDEKEELWAARKVALWSTIDQGKLKNENIQLWTTDAAVPISKLPQFLKETKQDIDSHGLENTLVAHIGDGNAHSFILYDPSQRAIAEKVVDNMVRRAINFQGTCTGEHGIGLGKRDFLLEELGEVPVDLMRKLKLSLDPLRILNPDKIFKIDPNEPAEYHE